MSTTIGRKWPRSWRGQAAGHCSYCGVRWPTGKLRVDRSGKYYCPDDARGRDSVTLSELNAQSASEYKGYSGTPEHGAPYFEVDVNEEAVQRTTREDI